MKSKLFLIALTFLFGLSLGAQELLEPSQGFSKKKTTYVTLKDGKEMKGTLNGIKYKKGLIKLIKFEDESGKTYELEPSSVKFMYLPQSNLDKAGKVTSRINDAQKWNNKSLDQERLKEGYVYFESVKVELKKKTAPMLMQVLNPTFSKSVKVYFDPWANETASVGVGGIRVAGGVAKSYYIKFEDEDVAHKLTKKMYEKNFASIWEKCSSLSKSSNVDWRDLSKDIIKYTECEQ